MKVICPISGVSYTLTAPVRGHAKHPHPMLSSGIKAFQLSEWYLADWIKGDLPEIETHLLGCAYLLKLPVESVSIANAQGHSQIFDKFWAANMERLAKLAMKLEGKQVNFKALPRMTITSETIFNLPEWLDTLQTELNIRSMPISEKAKELNRESYKVGTEISARTISQYLEPSQIDEIVLRALRASPLAKSEQKALPVILADWACKVSDFPEHSRTRWQRVIQTIFQEDYINQILMSDMTLEMVKAIEEHMHLNTPEYAVGTSHSSLLMARLGMVIPVLEDFSPAITSRKKVNEVALGAALMGAAPAVSASESVSLAKSGEKKLTLTERLAARMAGMRGAV